MADVEGMWAAMQLFIKTGDVTVCLHTNDKLQKREGD